MKSQFLIVKIVAITLALFYPVHGFAGLLASLSEFDSHGSEINLSNVKSLELLGASLIYKEDGVATHFRVVSRSTDRCGSTQYVAYVAPAVVDADYYRNLSWLVLTDHVSRNCKDTRPARWEIAWYSLRYAPRFFRGTPASPNDPEACLAEARRKVCTMLYAPVRCSVSTIDNGVEPISPITVEGGNHCQANIAIHEAACVAGFDPTRIQPADINCVAIP